MSSSSRNSNVQVRFLHVRRVVSAHLQSNCSEVSAAVTLTAYEALVSRIANTADAIEKKHIQGAGARHRIQRIWVEHAGGQRRNDEKQKVQEDLNRKTESIFDVVDDLFRECQLNPEHETAIIRLIEAWPFLTRESRRLAAETSIKVLLEGQRKRELKRERDLQSFPSGANAAPIAVRGTAAARTLLETVDSQPEYQRRYPIQFTKDRRIEGEEICAHVAKRAKAATAADADDEAPPPPPPGPPPSDSE